jgi:hypothetical protein
MKIDWKKEWEFQRAQVEGMFHGLGEDLKITAILMVTVAGPIFGAMFLIDYVVRLFL